MKYIKLFSLLVLLNVCLGMVSATKTDTTQTQSTAKAFASSNPSCGIVYDGLSKGSHDIEHQTSTSAIGAHWTNFGPDVLYYEWAIISHHITLPVHSDFGRCFKTLRIEPDIQDWSKVGPSERSVVNKHLELHEGNSYRVLVRATYNSGEQLVSSSNGVRVINKSKSQDLPIAAFSSFAAHSLDAENGESSSGSPKFINKPSLQKRGERDLDVPDCPVDDENQCQTARVSVSEKLGETYGKPHWGLQRALLACLDNANVNEDGVIVPKNTHTNVPGGLIVGSNQGLGEDGRRGGRRGGDDDDGDGDDDDDNSYPWIIAPIVGGILLILCCLLLLLLLALLLTRGVKMPHFSLPERSPKKEKSEFPDFAEAEKEKKGYGMREEVGPGNVDSETRVEFPDTQVRRLSISHADGPEAAVSETHSPRRKHPIMSSTSSSFRDYHGVN